MRLRALQVGGGIIRSDQKLKNQSGMASFWTHNAGAVKMEESSENLHSKVDTSNILMYEFKNPQGAVHTCKCSEVDYPADLVQCIPGTSLS